MLAKLCVLIPLVIAYCGATIHTNPQAHGNLAQTQQHVQPQSTIVSSSSQPLQQQQHQHVQPQSNIVSSSLQPLQQQQQQHHQPLSQSVVPDTQVVVTNQQGSVKTFTPDATSCAKAAVRHRQCECAGFSDQLRVGVVSTQQLSSFPNNVQPLTTETSSSTTTKTSTVPVPNLHNCNSITVEQMNAHKEFCEKITPDCLHAFNVTGLNLWCLSKLTNLESIHSRTWKEIAAGDKEYLPVTNHAFMNAFLSRINKYGDKGKEISEWLIKSDTLLVEALNDKAVPREALARIITSSTIAHVRPAQAAKFDEKLLLTLDHDAFKNISPEAFAAIPPEAFAGIDSRFLKQINPLAFSAITVAQAEKLKSTAVTGLTKEQAKHFGSTPVLPPITATSDKEKKTQEAARKEYRTGHPCYVAKNWIQMLDVRARRALSTHCGEIINAGNIAGPNLFQTVALMFGVIFGVTLFI